MRKQRTNENGKWLDDFLKFLEQVHLHLHCSEIYVISFNSTHGFGVLFFTLVSLALLFWSTHLMHDHICSNNTLKGELLEVRVSEKRLLDKIQDLKVDYVKLIGDVLEKVVKQQVSEIMNLEIRSRMPCWQENYWLRRS
ncbi:kinesin protein KIN-12D [Trifolium repens]|nr:kinesin protein KIN-12D [Trifolium repens]